MAKVYSKYKVLGGFGLLIGLNLFIAFAAFQLLSHSTVTLDEIDLKHTDAIQSYFIVFGVSFASLMLFATQCRFLITDTTGIQFINPLLPFLRNKNLWTDFDYYILVEEKTRYDSYEAIWFIRNGRVKKRISSFYYTNYRNLKKQIKTPCKGKKELGQFEQLFMLLGLKRIKNKYD